MSEELILSAEEVRVVGALIEKQVTTPEYYPLTLNALRQACNQLSNREPVVSFDERTVTWALESLRDRKLVRGGTRRRGACRSTGTCWTRRWD